MDKSFGNEVGQAGVVTSMTHFRRANAILPEPLEGFGRTVAPNHGKCIVCGRPANRATRRYSAHLLGRGSRLVYPTMPYCRDHGLEGRARINLGLPILLPSWALEEDE